MMPDCQTYRVIPLRPEHRSEWERLDLFVDPAHRGDGVATALMQGLANIGQTRGWSAIRWLTAEDNYRARSFYDKISARRVFLTDEMKI